MDPAVFKNFLKTFGRHAGLTEPEVFQSVALGGGFAAGPLENFSLEGVGFQSSGVGIETYESEIGLIAVDLTATTGDIKCGNQRVGTVAESSGDLLDALTGVFGEPGVIPQRERNRAGMDLGGLGDIPEGDSHGSTRNREKLGGSSLFNRLHKDNIAMTDGQAYFR